MVSYIRYGSSKQKNGISFSGQEVYSLKIALYTHPQKDAKLEKIQKTAELIESLGSKAFLGEKSFSEFEIDGERRHFLLGLLTLVPDETLGRECDLMICIGGDGTILRAAKLSRSGDIPLVGVNSGRIGYMAELQESETDKLADIISGRVCMKTETRMMLDVSVLRNGNTVFSMPALNEATVSKGAVSRMLDLELVCDGREICTYRADGIIAATPTGSTAYAMSAGGPIVDPSIECIMTVPVCAYLAVNSSPVIFSPKSEVGVIFRSGKGNSAFLSIDGGDSFELREGDRVCIKRDIKGVRFIKFRNIDFYRLLNLKLTRESGFDAVGGERGAL